MAELEAQSLKLDFWQDNENAAKVQQEISGIKEEIEAIEKIEKDLEVLEIETDEPAFAKSFGEAMNEINKQEFKTFLSGKYDKNNAILEIFSGAGGQDAQDWVTRYWPIQNPSSVTFC